MPCRAKKTGKYTFSIVLTQGLNRQIRRMCALAGLEVAALTDHNTCGNCAAFCRAAERYGLLALPGMELTTAEEAHVVCLFPGLEEAGAFSALVREKLPPIPNNPAVFGPQLYLDEKDRPLGEETAFLAGAAAIGIYEAAALVRAHGGVAYPAHIDRPSFSLLANLGLWDPAMGFPVAETSRGCPPDLFQRPDLRGVAHFDASDAHYLDQIQDAHRTILEGILRFNMYSICLSAFPPFKLSR